MAADLVIREIIRARPASSTLGHGPLVIQCFVRDIQALLTQFSQCESFNSFYVYPCQAKSTYRDFIDKIDQKHEDNYTGSSTM